MKIPRYRAYHLTHLRWESVPLAACEESRPSWGILAIDTSWIACGGFLDRVEAQQASDVEFQDMIWAFFQNCWHLKDWVRNDPVASAAQEAAVIQKVHDSDVLRMCRDLCNGTKHLGLDRRPRSGTGAAHHHVDIRITPGEFSTMDCMVEDGRGSLISGKQLARDCVGEWERILQSEQLNTTQCS